MHFARNIMILLVGLALAGAAPRQASAQSEPELESDLIAAPTDEAAEVDQPAQDQSGPDAGVIAAAAPSGVVIEQHSLAQAGLGLGFMFRFLQSQLNINDAEDDGNIGKCTPISWGASVKLKRQVGSFVRKSTVDVYYDPHCKDAFIDAQLTVDENPTNHFNIVETATFHKPRSPGKPIGAVIGKLTLKTVATKTASVTHFAGAGTWTPTGGNKVQGAVKCDYPRKLKNAKPFTCSFAVAQPVKSLAMDIASAAVMKFKVVNAPSNTFEGVFTGPVELYTGKFGKLGALVPKTGPAAISGSRKHLGTTTAKGSVFLTVFWPPPSSWSVTDAAQQRSFAIEMEKGPSRDSAGTIKHKKKDLATFSVDKSGEGLITYSDRHKSKILNWLPVN